MSNDLLASKVVVYEETPGKRTIKPAATSVVGALGVAERGPIGVPVWVTEETFPEVFGDFTLDSDLALSVRAGFFKNAKAGLWVVRTCHYSDPTNPASIAALKGAAVLNATGVEAPAFVLGTEKAPFRLNPGDAIILSEGGHADDIVAFTAGPASVDAVKRGPVRPRGRPDAPGDRGQ